MSNEILNWVQIAVSVFTLAGVAFAVGRLVGRLDSVERVVNEMRDALFGVDGKDGGYIRRTEAEMMYQNTVREHKVFDDRLSEISERIGKMEATQERRRR